METGYTLQGKYVIERLLGKGGMGSVYLAHQSALGKKLVAIKQMEVTVRDNNERARVIEQFQREARLLATLDHPSLVTVHDYFEEGDNHFLVMTFVDGQTLEEVYVEQMGELDIEVILTWIDQVCDVLTYLHNASPPVIYRDLKPSNVMVDKKQRIWLLDFGIAKVAEPDSKTSTLIKGAGTLGYAPVEQFGHASTDARSDIYSLGATLYSLVTGSQPPVSVDLMLNDARLIPPSQINPDVTADLEGVIFKMMALRKDDRYQTVKDARAALAGAARKLHEQRERRAARDAPGALKLKFVKSDQKKSETIRPFSQPQELENPDGGSTRLPGAPGFPSPYGPRIPGLGPPPGNAPDVAPRWVEKIEHTEADPSAHLRGVPWWQGPHALWYVYLGVGALCLLLALPSFANAHSIAIVPGFNFLFYSIGSSLSKGLTNETWRRMGGLVLEFGIPFGIGFYFYLREDFFPALLGAYFVAQGLGDLALDLRYSGRPNGVGPGFDLYAILNYGEPPMYAKTAATMSIVAHILTALILVYMAKWLYNYRPRQRTLVVENRP